MSDPKQETLQQRIRRECIQQVGNDFLQSLYTKGPGNFLVTVSHLWAGVLLAFLVGMWTLQSSTAVFMWIYLPLALFIATRINGLNVQVHEGSHGLLSESRLANDLLCNWMAAYPTLYDVDQYSAVHGGHHVYLNESRDPEVGYYRLPTSRAGLFWLFFQDLFWITLFKRIGTIGRALAVNKKVKRSRWLMHVAGRLISVAAMLAMFYLIAGWQYAWTGYFLLWIVPLFSFYPMLIRLRQVTEHAAPGTNTNHSLFVARSTQTNWLEHYLLGAQMEYHFEHHLFPSIPYKNLGRLHARLQEINFFNASGIVRLDHSLSQGYLHFWWHVIWHECGQKSAGGWRG